jgi:uncharacterized membrane protein YdfJ with MMPL/SSD domain
VAVLIDATIVRIMLLPSAMALLGERNWYLPRRPAWTSRRRGWTKRRRRPSVRSRVGTAGTRR